MIAGYFPIRLGDIFLFHRLESDLLAKSNFNTRAKRCPCGKNRQFSVPVFEKIQSNRRAKIARAKSFAARDTSPTAAENSFRPHAALSPAMRTTATETAQPTCPPP
jgi:hypothetical protein